MHSPAGDDADDATYEDVALGQTHEARESIIAFVDGMTRFSSDYRFESVSEFSTDTDYVVEWELSGTHDGDGAGPPATGRSGSAAPSRVEGAADGSARAGASSDAPVGPAPQCSSWPSGAADRMHAAAPAKPPPPGKRTAAQRVWTLVALFAMLAPPVGAQEAAPARAPTDTLPDAVVQRFVDAANARNAAAMSALVAPGAVFERFPSGAVLAESRDSVHAFYARLLPRLSSGFRITVQPRIVEGDLVIDQEHFTGTPAEQGRATWIYQVRGGLIHRAWVLDGHPAAAP